MDRYGQLFLLLLLVALFGQAFLRVTPSQRRVQHPGVLKRPPTQLIGSRGGRQFENKRNQPKTTEEPPEFDDDILTTTSNYGNYGQGGFGYGVSNSPTPFYDYGTYTGSGTSAGGTSWEYDDDVITTQMTISHRDQGRHNRNNRLGPSYQVNTTPRPTTTTTPEPPERENERPIGSSLFGTQSGPGDGGICFCSPLKSCPSQSVPRGGLCLNFLSYFTGIKFIRCCYSPSLAKRMV